MTLENILLLLIVGGVIGGIAHILAQFRIENSTLRVNGQMTSFIITIILIVFSGFVGIAGAVAIQFILIMLGAFRTSTTLTDEMFVLSISVAAGFGAKQLLPQITENLLRKLREIDQKATEAETTSEHALHELITVSDHIQKVDESIDGKVAFFSRVANVIALENVADAAKQQDINKTRGLYVSLLRERIAKEPLAGAYRFPCGRLLKLLGRLDEAITEMDSFLRQKKDADQIDDPDFADASYNKGCYHALRWVQSDNANDKNAALEALKTAFRILPSILVFAESDPDLARLRETPEWAQKGQ